MTKITILTPGPVEIITIPEKHKQNKAEYLKACNKAIRQSDIIITLWGPGGIAKQAAKNMYYARERGKRIVIIEPDRVWEMKAKR